MSTIAENFDDVIGQLRSLGLIVETLEFGRLVRCKVEGDREKRGWYSLHEVLFTEAGPLQGKVGIFGAYGVWRGNENNAQKIQFKKSNLSIAQLESIRQRMAEDKKRADAQRKRETERAAIRAQVMWDKLSPTGDCEYLARKQVKGYGVRFTANGTMAVPMLDERGRIHGLQFIGPAVKKKYKDRDKEFWPKGHAKKGMFFSIASPDWIVLVAEGYATGASLHEATGYPVVIAFDAGNLLPVSQALHKKYPWVRVLVCADDDSLATCSNKDCHHIDEVVLGNCPKCTTPYRHGNTGVEAAAAAALAVGGGWVKPNFKIDGVTAATCNDFNDLHVIAGLHSVSSQIGAKVDELGWSGFNAFSRVATSGGAGDANSPLKALLVVDEAATRYSLVYGSGGSLFDHQEHELVPKSDVMDLLEDHGWRDWKRHPRRSVVRLREVGFDPSGTDTTIRCNLWGGWPTQPKSGSCKALLELLQYLCAGEEKKDSSEVYDWVLRWLAYPIQHPGAKMKTALIFHGPQGVGKNMFFEAIMAIYGRYGRIVDQNAIEDKFNDWASKKLFLIADEVVARQELFHTKNKLKGFITGDWIRINPKNVAAHEERNHVNIVFLSNETQPLVLEKDDRRYTVIWTPVMLSEAFYRDIAKEIDEGSVAALHEHLLQLDLGDFKPWTRPPMTKAKQELIDVSLDSTQRFLREWQSGETPYPFCPAKSTDLYSAYYRYCRSNGVSKPRESGQFLGYIGKLPGWSNQPRHIYSDGSCNGETKPARIVIPDEVSLAKVKKNRTEDQSMARWLTEHVLDFAMTLEGERQ